MKPTGKGKRKILFIAEAPGETEDREGVQLVGDAGKLLRKILRNIGVDLDDCWKTNAVICRPPENEIRPQYITACRPNLLATIRELEPNVIILLGKSAVDGALEPIWQKGVDSISRWIGWHIPVAEYSAWVCPTYHPSYLLRMKGDPLLEVIFERHLQQAVDLEKVSPNPLSLEDLKKQVEIILDEREARARLRDISKREGRIAFDYETTGLKPERPEQQIVSCSICYEGRETIAFQMSEKIKTILSNILQSEALKKTASNMKFEERWTREKFGHGVAGWDWDTMLAAHELDNRPDITSIKFQAFIHLGIGDYNSHIGDYLKSRYSNTLNRIHELDVRDLLLYNGLDSLLEFLVMEKQRAVYDTP